MWLDLEWYGKFLTQISTEFNMTSEVDWTNLSNVVDTEWHDGYD